MQAKWFGYDDNVMAGKSLMDMSDGGSCLRSVPTRTPLMDVETWGDARDVGEMWDGMWGVGRCGMWDKGRMEEKREGVYR